MVKMNVWAAMRVHCQRFGNSFHLAAKSGLFPFGDNGTVYAALDCSVNFFGNFSEEI